MLPVSYRRSVILNASHQNLTSSPSSARKLTWNPVPHRLLHRRQHQALVRLQRRLPVHTRFRLSVSAACRDPCTNPDPPPLDGGTPSSNPEGCPFGYQLINGACCVPIACPPPTPAAAPILRDR